MLYSIQRFVLSLMAVPNNLIYLQNRNVGREDEEEVGPTPIPGGPDGRVPVWPESNRTGEGRKFKPDSEQLFPPLSNSQVIYETLDMHFSVQSK